jgi:hypothetical protein
MNLVHTIEINGFSYFLQFGYPMGGVCVQIENSNLDNQAYIEGLKIALSLHKELGCFQRGLGEAVNYAESANTPKLKFSFEFLPVSSFPENVQIYIPSLHQMMREELAKAVNRHEAHNQNHREYMRQKSREARNGYVYLLKSHEENPCFKIGRSKKLDERMGNLRTKLPFETTLIHAIKTNDSVRAEAQLHKRYDAKRINGEWFKLSDEDVKAICAIPEMMFEVES